MKTAKPTGKEDELRMPADEFDRIMRQAFQDSKPEPLGTDETTPVNRPAKSKK